MASYDEPHGDEPPPLDEFDPQLSRPVGSELHLIDWDDFWAKEHEPAQWLAEPLIALGRAHSIAATAKTGKSLLLLEVAAALATGRPVLDQPAGDPVSVLYLDMEMTEADVRERLETFGYGPANDLSRLHYALLPHLVPLNTPGGGQDLLAICQHHDIQLVCLDTFQRVLHAEENAAEGAQGYYRHTGLLLKAADITVVRLDHLGKDRTKGSRG